MSFNLRLRLSIMMLLQYGSSGAWSAVAGKYFSALGEQHGFNGDTVGFIFSLMPLATIITPFGAGQIADRYMNTERFLALLHLLGAVVLLLMAAQTDYRHLAPLMFLYALCYAPTGALTNSLTFHHITDSAKQFGGIRVFGTIGWIIAGWMLGAWRFTAGQPVPGDLFYLAAILGFMMGFYCLTLPKTPPRKEGANPLAFLDALALLKDRQFAVFMGITFVASTALDFHYIFASAYLGTAKNLGGLGLSDKVLPFALSVAQFSEIIVMASLPLLLPRLGVRRGVVVGTLAWSLRYAVFAFHPAPWMVVSSLALHGFCVVFFFVIVFIYLDQIAPSDIRASAQSLAMLTVFGLGRFAGSYFAGQVKQHYTHAISRTASVTDWRSVFLIPCILTLVCSLAFPLLCPERSAKPAPTAEEEAAAEIA